MKNLSLIVLVLVILGIFFGCATLSKNECLQANWYELGYRDGSMGAPRSLFQKHHEACLDHSIQADRKVYFKGREEGLIYYCTYDSGLKQGKVGKKYHHVCSAEREPDFLAGYNKGYKIYKFESKIASLENRLKSIENQIQTKERQLYKSKLKRTHREKIRADIRYLDIEYRDVVRELKYLEKMRPLVE